MKVSMRFRFRVLAALAFAGSMLPTVAAQAEVQRWVFNDVQFRDYQNTLTGEAMDGGTLTGFLIIDTDSRRLVSWNIFTSPGWAFCRKPAEGDVCYVEGLHWHKGNSYLFDGAARFVFLRGDQNTYPVLAVFAALDGAPGVAPLDLFNSNEIFTDTPNTYRQFSSGQVVLANRH